MLATHNPDIIVLMETKVNTNRAQHIIKSLNIRNFIEIPPEAFSKGILLLWTHIMDFQLGIIYTTNRFIHCQISEKLKHIS